MKFNVNNEKLILAKWNHFMMEKKIERNEKVKRSFFALKLVAVLVNSCCCDYLALLFAPH
jgi:hypothetical protein